MDIEGDAFGKIYETSLASFAMTEGQKGGECSHATSIVKLIVEIIEPFHGRIYDPGLWLGRHVRPVGGVRGSPTRRLSPTSPSTARRRWPRLFAFLQK